MQVSWNISLKSIILPVLLVGIIALFRVLAGDFFGSSVLLFFMAVLLSTFYGGYVSGLLATVLSLAAAAIISPLPGTVPSQIAKNLVFLSEGVILATLVEQRQRSQEKLRQHINDLTKAQNRLAQTNERALEALEEALDWDEEAVAKAKTRSKVTSS